MIFVETEQFILTFIYKGKEPKIAKVILKNKRWKESLPNLQTYHITIVTRQCGAGIKRHTSDQRNTVESSEVNPHTCSQPISDKDAKGS